MHIPELALLSVLGMKSGNGLPPVLLPDLDVHTSDVGVELAGDAGVDMGSPDDVECPVEQCPLKSVRHFLLEEVTKDGDGIVVVSRSASDGSTLNKSPVQRTDVDLVGVSSPSEILDQMFVDAATNFHRFDGLGCDWDSYFGYFSLVARFGLDLDVGGHLVVLFAIAVVSATLGGSSLGCYLS